MPRTWKQPIDRSGARRPLMLTHYSSGPTFSDQPTLGLKALQCPFCRSAVQRLIRAQQQWRDGSEYLRPHIPVTLDFLCNACDRGWQMALFNEDEGLGELIIAVKAVATVHAEDAEHFAEARGDGDGRA